MKHTLYFICMINFVGIVHAMEESTTHAIKAAITKQTVTDNRENFLVFLDKKKDEYRTLQEWTNPNSFLGSLFSTVIEWVTPWTRYGKIEPEKTKTFLGRAFTRQEELKRAVEDIDTGYLNTVISKMTKRGLREKNLAQLAKIMKENKYPDFETEKMGAKSGDNEYVISDDQFYPFAATTLFAVYLVEK